MHVLNQCHPAFRTTVGRSWVLFGVKWMTTPAKDTPSPYCSTEKWMVPEKLNGIGPERA